MLSFACKNIDFKEAMYCSLGISKSEYKVLDKLYKLQYATIKDISKSLGYDRSTIQKFIKNLLEKNIIKRRQENLKSGGYEYYYIPKNKEELKKAVKSSIHKWTEEFYDILDKW